MISVVSLQLNLWLGVFVGKGSEKMICRVTAQQHHMIECQKRQWKNSKKAGIGSI